MRVDKQLVHWLAETIRRFPVEHPVVVVMHPKLWHKILDVAAVVSPVFDASELPAPIEPIGILGCSIIQLNATFPANFIDLVDGQKVVLRLMLGG